MREEFEKWLQREMPAGTVISDPLWWAPRIWQAATSLQAERVRELEEALKAIVNPVLYLRKEADLEGEILNGAVAVELSKDAEFLKSIAQQALSATAREG